MGERALLPISPLRAVFPQPIGRSVFLPRWITLWKQERYFYTIHLQTDEAMWAERVYKRSHSRACHGVKSSLLPRAMLSSHCVRNTPMLNENIRYRLNAFMIWSWTCGACMRPRPRSEKAEKPPDQIQVAAE